MKQIILTTAIAVALSTGAALSGPVETVSTQAGKVLAAGKTGLTLYTFRKDAPNKSNCYDQCAEKWPPFFASASAQADGALGIVKRKDGQLQWAMNGQPLYFWVGDAAKGDVTGDGVGGVWDAARP